MLSMTHASAISFRLTKKDFIYNLFPFPLFFPIPSTSVFRVAAVSAKRDRKLSRQSGTRVLCSEIPCDCMKCVWSIQAVSHYFQCFLTLMQFYLLIWDLAILEREVGEIRESRAPLLSHNMVFHVPDQFIRSYVTHVRLSAELSLLPRSIVC